MLAHLRPTERIVYMVVGFAALFGLGFAGSRQLQGPAKITFAAADPQLAVGDVVVHVVGAVKTPGLYHLKPGARIQDAIDASGGTTAEANPDAMNLAAKLVDGQQIHVPQKGEEVELVTTPTEPVDAAPTRSGSKSKKIAPAPASIDLNSVGEDELVTIPGIGPSTASKIIELRTQKGSFKSIDELREIRGLTGKRFEALKTYFRI